ncbi:MAG: histidine-type phosphatase, partial [Betaproteobacteria bacterium]
VIERTPYVARRRGSSLLARVASALTGSAVGGVAAPDPLVRDASFVAFVGHDTNLANLGGMLEATWSMPGWPVNETPPAGALWLELRRQPDGRQWVYASYVAQSAAQMRDATPLSLATPPVTAAIRIPGCSTADAGYPCPVDAFVDVVNRALDPDCVEKS